MKNISIHHLEKILNISWSKNSSYSPGDWTKDNPALGQCAVTALIIQDLIGGEIVWAKVLIPNGEKSSHYFNLINGTETDITRRQFPHGTIIPKGIEKKGNFETTREYMLSFEDTRRRYEILKQSMEDNLADDDVF